METNWHKNAEVEKKELYFSFHRSRNICISTDRLKDTFVQESEKKGGFPNWWNQKSINNRNKNVTKSNNLIYHVRCPKHHHLLIRKILKFYPDVHYMAGDFFQQNNFEEFRSQTFSLLNGKHRVQKERKKEKKPPRFSYYASLQEETKHKILQALFFFPL